MFLFGILSSPLPYLLMAVFYFIGFATGMFKTNVEQGTNTTVQVKNIQVDSPAKGIEKSENTFQYNQYDSFFQKEDIFCDHSSLQPPPVREDERLKYFVHDKKINHTFTANYSFCRPPPTRS